MLTKVMLIFATVASVAVSTGCAGWAYQGDGKLRDSGPLASHDRYVLDLGPIDLDRTGEYTYTMSNLPADHFTIGLEIVEAAPNSSIGNRPPHPGRIRLLLETSNHEIVVSEDSALNSWIWSYMERDLKSFLYRAGEEHWITNKDGTTSPVPDGVRTDGGWGTYFSPRPDITYRLTLEVLEAQPQPQPTRLLVKGGGWK
jgi:hypothetical protein